MVGYSACDNACCCAVSANSSQSLYSTNSNDVASTTTDSPLMGEHTATGDLPMRDTQHSPDMLPMLERDLGEQSLPMRHKLCQSDGSDRPMLEKSLGEQSLPMRHMQGGSDSSNFPLLKKDLSDANLPMRQKQRQSDGIHTSMFKKDMSDRSLPVRHKQSLSSGSIPTHHESPETPQLVSDFTTDNLPMRDVPFAPMDLPMLEKEFAADAPMPNKPIPDSGFDTDMDAKAPMLAKPMTSTSFDTDLEKGASSDEVLYSAVRPSKPPSTVESTKASSFKIQRRGWGPFVLFQRKLSQRKLISPTPNDESVDCRCLRLVVLLQVLLSFLSLLWARGMELD
ncbi:hypothetical protein BZA70DRAFT_264547 [Myxozyma melibiosi]|uniref:Uncharacterized protein n=1 Tax=Myxozyma melibiosi TaxID=54550 RepID=A0ABR1FBC0_9ASCO